MNWIAIDWAKPPKGEVLLFWPERRDSRGLVTHYDRMAVGLANSTPSRPPTHYMPLPPKPEAA